MGNRPEFEEPAERPSKSARKREAQALRELAETLLALAPAQLAELNLGAALSRGLEASRTITHPEARRRQLQYLGKLIRDADSEVIRRQLEALTLRQRQFRQRLERIDRLCEQLLTGGDSAIETLLTGPDAARGLERQQLRQLVRNANRANAPAARRKLFDYLRRHLL